MYTTKISGCPECVRTFVRNLDGQFDYVHVSGKRGVSGTDLSFSPGNSSRGIEELDTTEVSVFVQQSWGTNRVESGKVMVYNPIDGSGKIVLSGENERFVGFLEREIRKVAGNLSN